MKGKSSQQRQQKSIKLPQINRTSQSFRGEDKNVRPQSSKKIDIDDMERKLFSKLDSFDLTDKPRNKKRRTAVESCQQIKSSTETNIDEGLEKIQKLMPNLYSKLIDARKYEPLKQSFKFESNVEKIQQEKAFLTDVKGQNGQKLKSIAAGRQLSSSIPNVEKKETVSDPFDLCDSEMNKIYKEYLESEGLPQDTSSFQLQRINNQLLESEKEVTNLMKSYKGMIKKLKTQCAALQEDMDAD